MTHPPAWRGKEGVMKKTGKAGFGNLKKMEKVSRQMLSDHAAHAAVVGTRKVECRARRRCA